MLNNNTFNRFLFSSILLTVFFFSGAASLIYQIAWQRVLTLYYGVGSVSVAIIVSTFLFGLGVGSLLGGWISEKVQNRIGLYFIIEILIGLFGLISLWLFQSFAESLATLPLFLGFLLIVTLLLVPTVLMGMTLPLVLKILNKFGQDPGHTLSMLYCVNTFGAALGAVFGSYVLISLYGLDGAVKISAFINFVLAILVLVMLALGRRLDNDNLEQKKEAINLAGIGFAKTEYNYLAVFLTGFLAIGYQMIWFRVITVLLKPSSYGFASLLGVYLTGIGLGSYWMSRRIRKYHATGRHKDTFFKLNANIALITLITFGVFYWGRDINPLKWMVDLTRSEMMHPPYYPLAFMDAASPEEFRKSIFHTFDIFIWPTFFLLPSTFLMGASFPLISAMAINEDKKEGWRTGLIYGVNIVGNVLGALITGFVFFKFFGTEWTLKIFTAAGFLWLLGVKKFGPLKINSMKARAALTASLVIAAFVILPARHQLYLKMHSPDGPPEKIVTEDIDGVVVSYTYGKDHPYDIAIFMINGSPQATYPASAYKLEVMETVKRAASVEKVLVIGFGGGDITNTVLSVPGVKEVTVVEISQALTDNLKEIPFYEKILSNPKLTYLVDDGRRYIQNTNETYDMIFMDPLRFSSAYSNNIYSQEFFKLVRERLKPDGVFMAWMNEYNIIPNTLASVFDHMDCLYYFCVNSQEPMALNQEQYDALWDSLTTRMQKSVQGRVDYKYYYRGNRDDIIEGKEPEELNKDLTPRTEYYLGHELRKRLGR